MSYKTLDQLPELILEPNFRMQDSLDPHICSLNLRAMTNNPTDQYGLAVSVSFGSEKVQLHVDDELIEFSLSIFCAEIVTNPANCSFEATFERDKSIEKIVHHTENSNMFVDESSVEFRTTVDLGTIGIPELKFKGGSIKSRNKEYVKYSTKVEFKDDNMIRIESFGDKPEALNGNYLDDYVAWHVLPQSGADSGVLARVRIREDWVKLESPSSVGVPGKIWKLISALVSGERETDRFKRKAFDLLISHLVYRGLQDMSQTREATIAIDTVLVRPREEFLSKGLREDEKSKISIDGTLLGNFLNSKATDVPDLLIKAGVSKNKVDELPPPPAEEDDDIKIIHGLLELHLDLYFNHLEKVIKPNLGSGFVESPKEIQSIKKIIERSILQEGNAWSICKDQSYKIDFYGSIGIFLKKGEVSHVFAKSRSSVQKITNKHNVTISGNRYYITFNEIWRTLNLPLVNNSIIRSIVLQRTERLFEKE